MQCPACGCEDLRVIDSRSSSKDAIRRRRECESCGLRFTTYERREEHPLAVVKRNGTREPFDRQKIMRGLVAATVKRDLDVEQLDQLIGSIEEKLRDSAQTEVSSADLGEMVLQRLMKIDDVASIRFASVYRHFDTPEEFSQELRRLTNDSR